MRFFFWQGGLHIEPESEADRQLLTATMEFLKGVKIGHGIGSSMVPGVQGRDQHSVSGFEPGPGDESIE